MSDKSAIEWTEATWNPVTGCDRVSAGCDHCYAQTLAKRLKAMGSPRYQRDGDPRTSGPGFGVTLHPDQLTLPLRWRVPRTVFVNSMSDLFHDDVPDEFVADVFGVMGAAERHTFQVLTKRPGRMASLLMRPEFIRDVQRRWWARWFMLLDTPNPLPTRRADDPAKRPLRINNAHRRALVWSPHRKAIPLASSELPWPLPNVWVGTSVETQRWADVRVPKLIETPAAVRFLSCEPLLGPIDLGRFLWRSYAIGDSTSGDPSWVGQAEERREGIDWVIVGGESGPDARPMHPEWARSLRDQCVAAGVPFFAKQGSGPRSGQQYDLPEDVWAYKEMPSAHT